jgi:hypothetical protein
MFFKFLVCLVKEKTNTIFRGLQWQHLIILKIFDSIFGDHSQFAEQLLEFQAAIRKPEPASC